MKMVVRSVSTAAFALLMMGTALISRADAQCASLLSSNTVSTQPQLWDGDGQFMDASFAERGSEGQRIVGFWKASFVSEGSDGIPDGTVVDSPFVQWHSDGTEIMNSTRAPVTQSFCLGIWHRTGKLTYELNHFALSFDTANNFVGPAQIREQITLDKKGNSYSGTFTIDQYDPAGNLLAEVKGNVTAARITVDTTINQVL
jgi:hypothetical protein